MGTYKKSLKNTLFLWWAATRSIVIGLPTCRRRCFRSPGGYGDIASCRSPSVVPRVRLAACFHVASRAEATPKQAKKCPDLPG